MASSHYILLNFLSSKFSKFNAFLIIISISILCCWYLYLLLPKLQKGEIIFLLLSVTVLVIHPKFVLTHLMLYFSALEILK